jgi:signal transduction histidine kinase
MFLKTLSGRFLILTTVFVLLAEVLVLVPWVTRVRQDYLQSRLESAQIAALALLANEVIDSQLEQELLDNARVFNVVLRRDEVRQLVLSSPIPSPIWATYDLRETTSWGMIRDAMIDLWVADNRVIRVIGNPVQKAGLLIEVTLETAPLRAEMLDKGFDILIRSAVISIFTAMLLFFAVRRFLVRPIKGVVGAIRSYSEAPEDARRVIRPQADLVELRQAEEALASMQTQLTGALRQKERLAQLGAAVAKVNHDLRNMLTTAQLFADRMEQSDDPTVKRTAPKLVNSISRAVNLCETTLAFGKAEEPPPTLTRFPLARLVNDIVDSERMAAGDHDISFAEDVASAMSVRADSEQLHRVIANLVRNARQAIVASGRPGEIAIRATETEGEWDIVVADTGPGLPPKAREHLFQPFQGGVRKDGFGLGLAIASELIRGHGGRLDLLWTGPEGTAFAIRLPKTLAQLEAAAE